MPRYVSQEWLDRQRELQQAIRPRAGATARVQYRLTDAPGGGEILYAADVRDGRVASQRLGADPRAEVTMSSSYADSVAMLRGELTPNSAFMAGRVKVTGDVSKISPLMPITQSAEYRGHIAQLLAETQF